MEDARISAHPCGVSGILDVYDLQHQTVPRVADEFVRTASRVPEIASVGLEPKV